MFGIVFNILLRSVPIVFGIIYKTYYPIESIHSSITIIASILELTIVLWKENHVKSSALIHIIQAIVPILFVVGCVFTFRNYQPEVNSSWGRHLIIVTRHCFYLHSGTSPHTSFCCWLPYLVGASAVAPLLCLLSV